MAGHRIRLPPGYLRAGVRRAGVVTAGRDASSIVCAEFEYLARGYLGNRSTTILARILGELGILKVTFIIDMYAECHKCENAQLRKSAQMPARPLTYVIEATRFLRERSESVAQFCTQYRDGR
jgi:hypothetical protein